MRIILVLVFHASIFLAGSVAEAAEVPSQSYPTGLRDDEDFSAPSSGSGEPPAEPAVPSSGSEPPVEPAVVPSRKPDNGQSSTKPRRPTEDRISATVVTSPSWWYTTPVTSTSTSTVKLTTTTTAYEFFTGVNLPSAKSPLLPATTSSTTTTTTTTAKTSTTPFATQLDDSCLSISYIPTYPWPVRIFCNRESNTLRAVCIAGQGQTCYCVDPSVGSILYDVIYPNCGGPVTRPRTTATTPFPATQPVTTAIRPKPSTRSTTTRLQTTTPRLPPTTTAKTTSTTTRLTTTTLESFKIDQETLDARADTTRSWDQGVPVIATFMGQPGLLAAIICGAVVGLLTAVLLVMFLVYRMRKKDEGSYVIEEPSKRVPLVQPYERTREYYA